MKIAKKYKIIAKTAFLLILVLGTMYVARERQRGASAAENTSAEYRHMENTVFGTVLHATYQSQEDMDSLIMATLAEVDKSLSMFNPKSTLARINRGETEQADTMLRFILPMAKSISEATDGAFDVTVAPLVNAWGFGYKHGQMPTEAQVDSLRKLVDYRKISITDDGKIKKADPRMVIDLSAIAKGFGSDEVARMFLSHGVQNFMVEIGGEIVTHGNNPEGRSWTIGISRPDDDPEGESTDIEETLSVHDRAMATSGNYRNFYITKEGRKVAHTIDPHTGLPVQHNVLSSTVLAPTCAMADGFATSFMVLGLDGAKKVLNKHKELQAYLIYTDGSGKYLTWTNIREIKK